MSRVSARSLTGNPTATPAGDVLFKPDRPRHIDQFIDYFGTSDATAAGGTWGDAFLSGSEDDE